MPQQTYYPAVPEGITAIKTLEGLTNHTISAALDVFNFAGIYTDEYRDNCDALAAAIAEIQAQCTAVSALIPTPDPNYVVDEDHPSPSLVFTGDHDIQVGDVSEPITSQYVNLHYLENYIKLTGDDGATPMSYESYVLNIVEKTADVQYVLRMRDEPPDFSTWSNLQIAFRY